MQPRHKALVAALLCTSALAVQAAEFTVLIYESPTKLASRGSAKDADNYWGAYNEFAGALAQAGVLRGGTALNEASTTVRGKGGSGSAVPGARLSGYFVIEVADLDSAKKWSLQAPASAAAVELVAHRRNPTMAEKPPVATK